MSSDSPSPKSIQSDATDEQNEIAVLYVEDDPQFVELAVTYFKREADQLVIEVAHNPAEGLAQFDDHIDCIVSDYEMPEMNGVEFLETIRRSHPDLPFILFTAKPSTEITLDTMDTETTYYFQKDLGLEQFDRLRARITQSVNRY